MQGVRNFILPQDTLLLLTLSVPHLWFNPVSSALVIIILAAYVALDFAFADGRSNKLTERGKQYIFLVRLFILLLVVTMAVLLPTGLRVMQRLRDGPASNAHDGLIQTEEAVKFLLEGKNPYVEDYVDTPMADFPGREPPLTEAPLFHFAYLPALVLLSAPFHAASQALMGWYDQRILYVLLFFGTLLLLPQLVDGRRRKLGLLAAFGLNFLFALYVADGRNDIVVLFGLVLTTLLLTRRRILLAAFILGITLAIKHSAWLFVPFYLLYLWPNDAGLQAIRTLLKRTWPMFAVAVLILIPFLVWDAAAFVDDTILYITGSGADSFPIKGWGISSFLLVSGVIPTPESAFPFVILSLIFGAAALIWALRRQRSNNTLQYMWIGFVVFSFVVQFFSRFFNDNYAIFIFQAFVIAAFLRPGRFADEPAQDATQDSAQPA
jgi:hypothetical protein